MCIIKAPFLYHNIQQLRGIQNQNNIREKLVDLFNSIDLEEQYRIDIMVDQEV